MEAYLLVFLLMATALIYGYFHLQNAKRRPSKDETDTSAERRAVPRP